MQKTSGLTVVFQDEVHFQAQTTITRRWAIKGSAPKVMSKPGNNKVSYSGFVVPEFGELYVNKPEWFNFETVIASLRQFLKDRPLEYGRQYLMVLDNAPWRKKAARLVWKEALPEYADIREKMQAVFLPPYSPDLNPIEQVWRITRKRKTHNRYFKSLGELTETVDGFFEELRHPNDVIRTLCNFKCYC